MNHLRVETINTYGFSKLSRLIFTRGTMVCQSNAKREMLSTKTAFMYASTNAQEFQLDR